MTTPETDSRTQFAEILFSLYPDFIPTHALYIDFEGRQNGSEDILSMYWPWLPTTQRFSWFKRSDSGKIDLSQIKPYLDSVGANKAKWIVVYSGGQECPDERKRFTDLLGNEQFGDSSWINLLYVVHKCREIKRSIREKRNVWHGSDKVRVRYSLEALEWEFGIERPLHIRSHSNCYRDEDGANGQMEVLSTSNRWISGTATEEEERALMEYCTADVKNMFEISYASERLIFDRDARRERRRQH